MASAWLPQVAPWSPTDKQSFAYKSVTQRWPTIITSAIDALFQASYALSYSSDRDGAETKIQESKSIVERMSKLKHDMSRDKPLEPIGDDGGDPTDEYDAVLQRHTEWTWHSAPWLFCECYLYRLLRSFFARSQHWQQYDPFAAQKVAAFRSSANAIAQLSGAVEGLIKKTEQGAHQRAAAQGNSKAIDEALQTIFNELVQTSLWGNATDLSLLTHMTHADLQQLQAGGLGAEAQAKRQHFILSGLDGVSSAWATLIAAADKSSKGQSHIDIILDNSGFELYTDLVLADFLLSSGMTEQVVFHPKDMPWFVSDTTPSDFLFTIEALQSSDFFTKSQESATTGGSSADGSNPPPRTSRSSSRQRAMVADMQHHYEGAERRDMSPAGSRVLRMAAVPEESASSQTYGSRTLHRADSNTEQRGRADEAQDAVLGSERGRPRQGAAAGSRSLQLDPSYFQNARSRTVSPSRSYVMDSGNMPSFSSILRRNGGSETEDGEESRGRAAVSQHTSATQRLAARWAGYLASGKFTLSMSHNTPLGGSTELHAQAGQADFWTTFHNYPSMSVVAPQLHEALSQSRLVISKGDLNYRKWCSDARWPNDTPFTDVLGPALGSMNLLVLRTNKADVCVGVPKSRLAGLDEEDSEWRVNGKYAMIEFVPKSS